MSNIKSDFDDFNVKHYPFNVAYVNRNKNAITENLMEHNPEYDMSKQEIIDAGLEGVYIYKYTPLFTEAELIPDQENPDNPDAIKVVVHGIHIGYIPAGKAKNARQIIDRSRDLQIICDIYGGDYKVVPEGKTILKEGSSLMKAAVSIKYV